MYTNTYHIPILALSVCPCSDGRIRVTGGFVAFHNEAARPEDEASQPAAHAGRPAQPAQPADQPTSPHGLRRSQPHAAALSQRAEGEADADTLTRAHTHTHTPPADPPPATATRREPS
jgi:hypothetical protein